MSQKKGLLQSPNNSFVAMELLQCPFLYIQKEKMFPRDEQENDGAPSSKRIESTPACTTGWMIVMPHTNTHTYTHRDTLTHEINTCFLLLEAVMIK